MINISVLNTISNKIDNYKYLNLSILNIDQYDLSITKKFILLNINNNGYLKYYNFLLPHEKLLYINGNYYVNDLSNGFSNVVKVYDYIDSENYNLLDIKYVKIKNIFLKKDIGASMHNVYNNFFIFYSIEDENKVVNIKNIKNEANIYNKILLTKKEEENKIINNSSIEKNDIYYIRDKYKHINSLYKECLNIEKLIVKRSSSRLQARWDEDLKFLNELIYEKFEYIEDLDKVDSALIKIENELLDYKKTNSSKYFKSIDRNIDISTRLDVILHPNK